MKTFALALLIAFPCTTFAEARKIEWAPDADGLEYYRGQGKIKDIREKISFGGYFEESDKKTGEIAIYIKSRFDEPVTVFADRLTIFTEDGEPLRVWSKAELVKHIEKVQFWTTLANSFAGAAESYSAGQGQYESETGSYSGSINGQRVSGNYTATRRDDEATDAAIDRAQERFEDRQSQINTSTSDLLAEVENQAWANQTIYPGELYFGRAVFDVPKKRKRPIPIIVRIEVNGEVFERRAIIDP